MADLRGFTRDLMRQMELDLATRLDWVAVDHHNTGHPHTHIIVRGVLDDGRILNIAGDYIAHGVRHRASQLVTRELGHHSEIELQAKLQNEVEAERVTRLDKMLLSEQREQGVIDLRPGEGATWLVRENRNLMIGRVKQLERYGLATEAEPGRWTVSNRAEVTLKDLGERNEVIKSIHRALASNGLAEERGVGQFALHGEGSGQKIVGRVLAKGLAGDEMGERVHLIVDGIDGRVHHIEFKDPNRIEEVGRDMIVEAAPVVSGPRPADRNIATDAADGDGIYRPSRHLERIRDSFERQGARTPKPSSAPMSVAWRPCDGPVMSNGSMPIIGRFPRTSLNADRCMTSARAAMGSGFGPCPPSVSRSRSAAMARTGSTGN
jgi:type IV secretory pathway VirD2 relaxase